MKILGTIAKALILIAVLTTAYLYRGPITFYLKETFLQIREYYAPCSQPLTYRIGAFDDRFGISKQDFIKAIKESEAIWESPLDKEFFVYDAEDGRMRINLIYDYRQEASSKLTDLGASVNSDKAAYDALVARYDTAKAQYAQAKSAYETAASALKARYQAVQQRIDYWNKKGGAPRREYEEIQAEQASVNQELSRLKLEEAKLATMVDGINSMVAMINSLARSLNLTVDKYNTIGSTLGESFEEGLYHSKGFDRQIDIYEFKDRTSLLKVLAHELGHSLDLDHVEDPNAIMYSHNQGTNKALTAADLRAIREKCGIK